MRYDDASQAGSMANDSSPVARPDVDALAPGSFGPATGNAITGAGTTTGSSGADSVGDAPGLIVAVQGAGGPASNAAGSFQATGQYGVLNMDAQGNFNYVRNAGTPDGVQDVFNYTLADNDGQTSATTLTFDIGKVGSAQAAVIPGVVNLPPGVQLSDIHVNGSDLVINMPDGTQMVIPGGAVFVPQLVIGDVQVPPSNLAALLVESEPQPGAGQLQSSGGNFATDVPPLDPGVPLGDLIPPTELVFTLPEFEPEGQDVDREPEAGTVSLQLDDDDVPGKGGNAGGVGDDAGSPNATASGFLPGSGGDAPIHWDLLTTGAPAGFSYVDGPNGSVLVQQVQNGSTVTVLTITIDASSGAFTVTENNPILHPAGGDENNVSFVINYSVIDVDGDTAPGTLNINVDDDTPVVNVQHGDDSQVILTTDDADTIGVNSDTAVTTANFSGVFSGTTVSPGADGAGPGTSSTYVLAVTAQNSGLTSHGNTINLFIVHDATLGDVVVGTTGGSNPGNLTDAAIVFTVSTTSTGIVTLTQFQQIDHPIAQDPTATEAPFADQIISMADGLVTLTRNETVTDRDGDSVTGSASVNIGANLHFTDDGPTIGLADRGEATLVVDETDLGTNDSASFAANFSANFGADGPNATGGGITYALGVSANGADSGLIDTATNNHVFLFVENGQVVGREGTDAADAASGSIVFTVSVDVTGEVSLDQVRAVVHPDGTNPDTDETVTLSADNLVTLTATATDFDGDTDSATLNIGTNLVFHDDGPDAQTNGNGVGTVTLDETRPEGTDTSGAGAPSGDASATINLAAGFVTGGAVDFGADGAGTVSYSLVLSANGIGSGMYAIDPNDQSASDGDGYGRGTEITLSQSGNVITGSANGVDYFTITINPATGVATFTQLDNIWQPTPGTSYDEAAVLSTALASNLQVVQTVTDADGDIDTASINLGQGVFQIQDDGPVAHNDSDTLPSGSNGPETGNVITGTGTAGGTGGAGADDTGEDTPVHITAISGTGGTDTTFTAGLLSIAGTHGTLTMDADGNYSYTRTDNVPGNLTDTFTYTLTDADGDTTTAQLVINMSDTVPTLPDPGTIHLDDDVIPGKGGNLDGPGDDDPDTVGANVVNGQLNGSGGDGTLTYSFTGTNTLPSGFTVNTVDADTIQVLQGATVVLTIDLNTSSGAFTVTQNNPILHDPTNPGAGAGQAGDFEDNLNFSIGVQVKDADNDADPATITINVDDDSPTIDVSLNAVTEPVLTTDDADTIGVNTDTAQSSANFGGLFNLAQSAGADGTNNAAVLAYALDVTGYTGGPAGVNSGLESHDADIFLYEISGKVVGSTSATLAGVNAGNTVFDVAVSNTGVVTLTQYQQIDHDTADPTPTGSPFNDHIVSLTDSLVTLTASSSITDKDGDTATDSASVNIGANLRFTDDGPDAATSGTAVGTVTLDETRAEGTDRGPGAGAPNGDASNTIDFSVNFVSGGSVNYGADGAGSTVYSLSLSGSNVASGLYALDGTDTSASDGDGYGQGGQIVLNQSGNTITGSFNGTNYFTITINPATGVVTFTQLNNIWHPTPGTASFDESATLSTALASNIQVVQTVTDFDGDTDTASINIGQGVFIIQDDGPQAIQPDDATVEDTAGQSALGVPLDDDGSLTGDFGTDLPGKITFANITPGGMATTETADGKTIELWLSADGQTLTGRTDSTDGTDGNLIYTVHINANGTYDFILNDTIDNGSGVSFDDLTSSAAGNVEFRGVGADDPTTTVDLLLSGAVSGADSSVNTDSDSIGTANQSMDAGETVRIDFVTNLTTDGADPDTPPSGFNYGAHVSSDSFIGHIPQVQGSQTETVAFTVYALNSTNTDAAEPDRNPAGGFSDATITHITDVTVIGFDVGQSTPVTIDVSAFEGDGLFHTVAYGISVRINSDGSATFSGIQQGDQYGFNTDGGTFNAVVVEANAAGTGGSTEDSFDLGIFAIGTVNQGDPIHLAFDINITDADGDTIGLNDAINVTINPAGTSSTLSTLAVSQDAVSDTSDTSSLFASSLDTQKVSDQTTTNSNNVLMGAFAAAGLAASEPLAAEGNHSLQANDGSGLDTVAQHTASLSPVAAEAISGSHGADLAALASNGHAAAQAANAGSHGADNSQAAGALDAAGSQSDGHAASQASQGTDSPANDAGGGSAALTASGINMPSAEQLAAAGLSGQAPSVEGQHNEVVGKVLADALHGGGHGPNVEALINSLPGHGDGGNAAADALASHAAGAVPNGDTSVFASFSGGLGSHMMEQMAMHADAAPAHA